MENFKIKSFLTVFADEATATADAPSTTTGTEPVVITSSTPKREEPKKSFSSEEVEKIVQDRVSKQKDTTEKMIKELEAFKTKNNITDKERTDLQKKIQELEEAHMSKEEIAKRQIEKLERERNENVKKLTEDANSWKSRYTNSTIDVSIVNSALTHNAFNANQIQAILKPYTNLVAETDKSGNETGNFIPKVSFPDRDNEGNAIKLDLTVEQAVKLLKEKDEYKNLFKDVSLSGINGNNVSRGGKQKTAAEYAKEGPEAYRKAKAAGLI